MVDPGFIKGGLDLNRLTIVMVGSQAVIHAT